MANPSEKELIDALTKIKSANPTLGMSKVHALLLQQNPSWVVGEKRTKKFLKAEGLTSNTSDGVTIYPSSKVIPNLDLKKWTTKAEVKVFSKKKGKGLVATADIQEGELIWKEDPFIVAPEWEIYDLQAQGHACALCTTPFTDSPLIIACPASSTSSTHCSARFCNRLCLARSAKVHPLLCAAQNPACVPLLKYARDHQWMALNALSHCVSRVLLANQYDAGTLKADWDVMKGLAALGMEERAKYSFKTGGRAPDRTTWEKAHQLVVQAFKEPKNAAEQKKLSRILKKPLPEEIDRDLFEYEPGFLRNLGKMSLNLESHGGLYTLHSHLNHSCTPNVSVRHNEKRTALSRISVIAKRPIAVGEELTITYVNPDLPYRTRQEELEAWGFGKCVCERCLQEETIFKAAGGDKRQEEQHVVDEDDLARELKAGLGVL